MMTMKIVVMTPTDLRDLQYFNIVLILKLDFFKDLIYTKINCIKFKNIKIFSMGKKAIT